MDLIKQSRKAIVGAGAAIVGAVSQAIAQQCGHVLDWKVVIGGAALGLVAVYLIPNAKPAA